MPVYEYRGQHYDIDISDPAEAKNKILQHLAETNKSPEWQTFRRDVAASPYIGEEEKKMVLRDAVEQQIAAPKARFGPAPGVPSVAEPIDYSAAATAMEGASQAEPVAAPELAPVQRGPGFMLRPEFVQEVRSAFAAIPPEKRRAALEQAAKGRGAEAQAAQRILEEVRTEDERRRIDMLGQERMAGILAEAPKVPVKGGRVGAPPPVQFPDVTPTFVEEIDRLKVPEAERVKKRLSRDEAERAIAAAQATPEAVGEREIEKRRGETQFLSELWTGAKRAAMVDLPTMWEGAGLFKDVGAAATLNQRLDLFDRIDRGEITSPDELRGLDISNAQARSYLSTTPENREKMRGRLINQIGDRKDLISTAIRTIEDYQQDAAQYRPLVDKPRNIGSKEDFVNWLGSTMGSGAVQMAPLMLAAAGTGGVGLTTLSAGMGLAESVGNRLKYIKDQVKDLPKQQQTDAIIEYLQKTGDTTLLSGIVSGALDAVLGPEARLLKMRANEIAKEATRLGAVKRELKEVPGQVAGEGVTGALQQAVQIAAGVQLKEKPEFWTKENIIDILESGAEEAAGSLGGAGVNVGIAATRRPPGAPRPAEPTAEEPPAAPPTAPLSAEDRQLLLDNAQQRLAELELKARGKEEQVITTPEGKKVRLPAEAAQFLTDDERAELAFLRGNATNADALQRAYEVSTEQETAPGKDVTDILQTIEEARQLMATRKGEALGTETTKALQTETQREEETATELADRIAAAEAEDTGFRPLTEAQSRRMAALSPSEREAMGFPVTPRAPRPAVKVSENPENIGMTGMDEANRPVVDLITAGAKPFPTKKAAEMGKAQRPDMKILKVANGWMLTPMTEADVARGERAGQRISAFQPGKAGMPTAAHEYIMERGGLTFDQQPNTDFPDENPKVGNRRLFSDKGMSLAQAAELLKEAGYIDEETETAAQAAISNSVKGKRVYTPEGYERAATLEKEAQTREAERAETEAGLYTPEADIYDYRYLEDPFRMPIAEVRTRAEAVGIPYDVIAEDVASRMPDATQEEYEDAVKTEVSNYAKSEGKFLSIEQRTETPEFKGWFGKSKVVDRSGKPMVMYHGTSGNERGDAFTAFNTYGSNYGLMGMGSYFTREPLIASEYARKGTGETPTVYPVYLSIQNPLDMDAKADAAAWIKAFPDAEAFHDGGDTNESWFRAAEESLIDAEVPFYEGAEAMQEGIRSMGYDGITHIGGGRVNKTDAIRHRVFIAFDPTQIKSAIGNRGTFDPTSPNILESIQSDTVQPGVASRSPSLKRKVKFLNKQREDGRLTDQQFAKEVSDAIELDEASRRRKPATERVRGADFIRQKLLEAKRRGDLSAEAVDFAEWFIRNNEALVDDLGIAIKSPKERGTAGQYNPMLRIMVLMKESAGDNTVVHEILHHLERMMPAEVQAAIRKEWLGRLLQAKRNAKTPEDKAFFELLMSHHFGDGSTRNIRWPAGSEKLRDRLLDRANKGEFENSYAAAIEMLRSGIVSADKLYQYVNPSEFWAVNGTEIVKGRFNAIRGGVLARLKNWLKELGQTIKALFGLRSDAPLIKALDSLAKGDGKFVSTKLIGEGDTFLQISGQPTPPSAPTPAAPPKKPLVVRAAPILFSADELNRPQFRAGVAAYKGVANIANKVLDKLYLKPASPELARAMRDMKAEINKVQNKLADVAAKLEKLPVAEREMISDVIEGELLAGVTPPKHVLDIAAAMQQMMREASDEAIRLDMLSPQAVQRWGDKYLPRFYQNKLRDDTKAWARAARALFARQPMMKGVVGRQFKGRGMFYTIDVNELPDWIAEGWEQRDPEFDPATSTETVVWRDYTREERENMGEIRDAMFRFVMGYNGIQRDLALGRLYESLADEYASKVRKEGYVRVPDIKVEGTNANRYGKLAGLYVPREIMDHLALNDQSMMDGVYKIYRAGLAKWKEGKTVLNPVAHANNVLSNVTMAHFAGVSYWDGHKYVGAIKDLAKNSDMVKEADDVGLFGGTFSQEEFMGSMPPKLRQMANMTASSAAKLGDKIWDALAYTVSWNGKKYGARPVMQWAYDGEDKFFRYVIYRDARLRGLDPKDARDYAQKFIFTYDDLPKGARLLRDFGMPFFGYTYKVIPVMLQTVAKYPWRFAAPASVTYAANAMMYAIAADLGGDEDDWWGKVLYKYVTDPEFRKKAQELEDQERKNLPPWLKGLSSLATPKAIRLWMDDVTNLPLFLDISRIFPGGDLLDAENNAGGVAFPQPLTPNNPVLTTLVAMLANRDMFRGKDVVKSTDTPTEKAAKQAAWLWKQITPAISVGNYHFDRAMDVIAKITGKPITVDAGPMGTVSYTGVGKDNQPVQPKHALLQTMGVKVRPYDLERSKEIEEGEQKSLIKEIQYDMSKLDRMFDEGKMSEEAYNIEYEKLEKKRDFLEEGLMVSGKEKK